MFFFLWTKFFQKRGMFCKSFFFSSWIEEKLLNPVGLRSDLDKRLSRTEQSTVPLNELHALLQRTWFQRTKWEVLQSNMLPSMDTLNWFTWLLDFYHQKTKLRCLTLFKTVDLNKLIFITLSKAGCFSKLNYNWNSGIILRSSASPQWF